MYRHKKVTFLLLGLGLILLSSGLTLQVITHAPAPMNDEPKEARNCVDPAPVTFEAPELSLHTLDEQPISLDSYRGKVVLLNAWATWCPPCLTELPDLESYFNTHKGDDFILLGVNIGEQKNKVSEFIEKNPISFPIWLDPGEKTLRALNTLSLPYSIVIDRNGMVRLAWSGATCLENLEASVTPIIRQ
jgi:peroxiredoxin